MNRSVSPWLPGQKHCGAKRVEKSQKPSQAEEQTTPFFTSWCPSNKCLILGKQAGWSVGQVAFHQDIRVCNVFHGWILKALMSLWAAFKSSDPCEYRKTWHSFQNKNSQGTIQGKEESNTRYMWSGLKAIIDYKGKSCSEGGDCLSLCGTEHSHPLWEVSVREGQLPLSNIYTFTFKK